MNWLRRHPTLITLPALLILWFVAFRFGWVGRTMLAGPGEVLERLTAALRPSVPRDEAIFLHAWNTIGLALTGWGIALGMGLVIGLLLGSRPVAYLASQPFLEFLRAVPPVLAFPLLLVAFSFGRPAYVWTIVFGCLPVMILAIARGRQTVDRTRLEILAVHQVSKVIRLLAGIMEILPVAFLGARITFSMSLVIAVVSEMVFSPRSGLAIGSLAKDAEISFDTATFYACVIAIGVYGYIGNIVLSRIERWLRGGARDDEV